MISTNTIAHRTTMDETVEEAIIKNNTSTQTPNPKHHQHHIVPRILTPSHTSDQATCLHKRKTTNVDIRSACGDSLIHPVQDGKDVRIFFQNVKGLPKDYDYYMTSTQAIGTDIIVGMPENNIACRQHQHHLQSSFASRAGKHYGTTTTSFQYPDVTTDPPVPERETFQSGGSLTMTAGSLVPMLHGGHITDPTGLGHWSGQSPTHSSSLATITTAAYRVCSGSIGTLSTAVPSAWNTNTFVDHKNWFHQDHGKS